MLQLPAQRFGLSLRDVKTAGWGEQQPESLSDLIGRFGQLKFGIGLKPE